MKKHTLRRFLALALSMVLCFSLLSTIALAQSEDEETNDAPTVRILTPVDTPESTPADTPPDVSPEASSQEGETPAESDSAASDTAASDGSASAGADASDSETSQDAENSDDAPSESTPAESASDEKESGSSDAAGDSGTETDSDTETSESGEGTPEDEEGSEAQPNEGETQPNEGENTADETKKDETSPDDSEAANPGESADAPTDAGDETADSTAGQIPGETQETPAETPDTTPETSPIQYGDKGVTEDGIGWEFTCDSTTGKYTLSFKLDKTSEDGQPAISNETLASVEEYAAKISAELAEKYGMKWEWDSAAAPSENEDVQKFQVFLTCEKDHTYKYDSVNLEQMDGEFTLEKVDDETGRPITGSETSFHLWHVNEVIDSESGSKMDVKMYCSYDAKTHTYTFVPTESTIQTIGGKLEILYAMMKDTVYYLQETTAPSGYEVDPSIHIVMEKDVWESKEESFRKDFDYLGEFTEDGDGRIGLDIKFDDIKTYSGSRGKIAAKPVPVDPEPEMPAVPEDPDPAPISDPTPEPDIFVEPEPAPDPVPNVVDEPEPPAPAIPEPEPAPIIDTNDIPRTGDMMDVYMFISLISAAGLTALAVTSRKKTAQK